MMWALAIKSKLTAATLLCAVLVVVILTNFSERNSSQKINTAISSIYKDRLVVEGYIFEYAGALNDIEEVTDNSAYSAAEKKTIITSRLEGLEKIHELYAATNLTNEEETGFINFTRMCSTMKIKAQHNDFKDVAKIAGQAGTILTTLSSIQMAEAKTQMDSVSRISSFSSMISQLELVILIIIAILVQILIFSSSTIVKAKMPENIHLN